MDDEKSARRINDSLTDLPPFSPVFPCNTKGKPGVRGFLPILLDAGILTQFHEKWHFDDAVHFNSLSPQGSKKLVPSSLLSA